MAKEKELKKLLKGINSLTQDLEEKDRALDEKTIQIKRQDKLISQLKSSLEEASLREERLLAKLGQTHQTITSVAEELKHSPKQEENPESSTRQDEVLALEKELLGAKEEVKGLNRQIESLKVKLEDTQGLEDESLQIDYFMASDDIIEVFVWQNPDLSKDVKIGPDGKISYPLVGRIKAAGTTAGLLEKKIKEGLSKYIKDPQVSVTVKRISGSKIVVLGEVNYPGIYTYTGSLNLIDAVGIAGDLTESAHDESVMIVRGNLTDNPKVIRINLRSVIREGTMDKNIVLRPNDVVYVPKSFIHNFNKFLSNITPSIQKAGEITQLRRDIKWWHDEN